MAKSKQTFEDNSDFFLAYFEKTSDAILLLENGVFTDCNEATVRMMRAKNKAEFLALHPSKVSPEFQPDGKLSDEKANEMIRIALEKGNNRFEWMHRRVDGEVFPVEVLLTPIKLGERDVIHTVWRDITQRKRQSAILESVAHASERLWSDTSWEHNVQGIIDNLGQVTGVSRVYIFQALEDEAGEPYTSQLFEWVAEGVVPEIDNPAMKRVYSRKSGFARWTEMLSQGKPIYGHVRDFPKSERDWLMKQDIYSIAAVPIMIGSTRWGYIGFDSCGTEREWSSVEIDALRAIASALGSSIQRKQADEALRAQAHQQEQILDASPSAILMTSITDGNILYANQQSSRLLGWSHDQLMKLHSRDLYASADDRALLLQKLKDEGHLQNYQVNFKRADGTPFPVYLSVEYVEYLGEKVLVSSFTDITQQKQAEKEVQESEERFRSLYDNATIGLYRTTPDGKILMINPAGLRMMGFNSIEEIAQRNLEETGFEVEGARKEFRELLERDGVIVGFENRWTKKDGTLINVLESAAAFRDENGKILYYDGSFQDITDRKKAEEELQSAKTFSDLIINSLPGPFFMLNTEGNLVRWNEAEERILGYSAEELRNLPGLMTIVEEERETLALAIQKAFTEGVSVSPATLLTKTGERLPYLLTGSRLVTPDGVYIVGTGTDLSEEKKADEALRKNEERFRTVADFTYDWETWLTPDGKYAYVSPSCERISGYKAEEFENDASLFSKIISPYDNEVWEEHIRIYHGAQSVELGEVNMRIVTRQGETRWIGHLCQSVHDSEGNWQGRRASNRDITERIQLELETQESLKRRERQMEVSTQVSQYISAATDMSDLYQRVVTQVKEQFGFYHTQILRYDAVRNAVVLVVGYGEVGAKMLEAGHQLPMGIGLIGTAASTGETVLRPTLAHDPDWRPNPLLPETKGEMAVPIKLGDTILGVLDVQSDTAGVLDTEDQIALEGLCGQIATAIESTRLRQETNERIEEVNRLYRAVSREGWQSYRQMESLPSGFMFEQAGVVPVQEAAPAPDLFTQPITVPGGEMIGSLSIPNDPNRPLSTEDHILIQQISEQIALAMESARLTAQTQSALAQTEKLAEAGLQFARAANLQELTASVITTINIPIINRAFLATFNYDEKGTLDHLDVVANWWNGSGHETAPVGTRFSSEMFKMMPFFVSQTPVFFTDVQNDKRVDPGSLELAKRSHLRAVAILPLYSGSQQIGALILESEESYNFTQDEVRLFSAMAPQIATVLENRRQFERAQKQAQREGMLNVISQKIQSATTVDDVLQIAARELGQALGAPMTIAKLSVKDRK